MQVFGFTLCASILIVKEKTVVSFNITLRTVRQTMNIPRDERNPRRYGRAKALPACLLAAALAGCGSLPDSGPRDSTFGESASAEYGSNEDGQKQLPFVLVNVGGDVTNVLASAEDKTYFKGAFTDDSKPVETVLGVGDVIRVTIFEAGPGGLFISQGGNPNGGNYVTLPDQEVDQTGRISIPYAGKGNESGFIMVAGRTLIDVQEEIQKRLLNKAIEPQVIVTTVKRSSNLYSVMGDVNSPGRFALDHAGMRMLDALSAAGGPRSQDYNTLVTLQRGGKSATARLSSVLEDSDNNIFLQAGDLLAVKKDERFYNVLGATQNNNRIAFESEEVTVADALAKGGGLNNDRAQPSSVIVFRREDRETLQRIGVSLEGQENSGDTVPTVYRINLAEPSGMFLAQKMQLRSNDVVYVSTHPFNDVTRFVGILRDVLLIRLIDN